MVWDGTERRENKRYGIKRLGIQYAKSKIAGMLGNFSDKYLVLNISEVGLFFMSREELIQGQKIKVKFGINGEEQRLQASAEVVWSKKSDEHNAIRLGLKFTAMSGRTRKKLKTLIDGAVLDKIDFSTGIYLREVDRL
ncbi:MAG: PilZ domain-containing protein [Candidatus Heimdallarchaeota archaeon]|nr:PilZ domain-containing protein [Candidatus Heimdallarchaeota archaeon]